MLSNNIDKIISEIGFEKILPVTKYMIDEDVYSIINKGFRRIGENRVDNLLNRMELLKDYDVEYHLIGHLQKNKVKKIINKIDYLHSLDSFELAELINKERITPLSCFIELKLTNNISKTGVKEAELDGFINSLKELNNINIVGFMSMTDKDMTDKEKDQIFKKTYDLKIKYGFKYLSIGMSNDYRLALKYDPKFVRLGHILYDKNEEENI